MVIGLTHLEKWINKPKKTKRSKSKKVFAAPQRDDTDNNEDNGAESDNGDDALVDQVEELPKHKVDKDKYYIIMKKLSVARKHKDNFASWDIAFRNHISVSLATPSSKASSSSTLRSNEACNEEEETAARDDLQIEFEEW
jgi:hypothetical protein